MKHIKMIGIAVCALCALFAGCKKKDAADGKGRPSEQVFAVTAMTVESGPISSYLGLSGDIIPGSSVDAYSDAAGKVTRVFVSIGSRVARGDPIALIDPSKPGMNYVQHTVHAPISGTVTSLPAEVGMTISQAVPLAKVAGGGALEIQLFVPERFVSQVRTGLRCEIVLDAYPGEIFRGAVHEVSPTIDVNSRTEAIKVNVDNQGARLKAGMFAKVKIITQSKDNAIKVPSNTIVQRQGKPVVFMVERGADAGSWVAREAPVTTGIVTDGFIEIVSGLAAGDEIVDKGMSLLTDGVKINIINYQKETPDNPAETGTQGGAGRGGQR